ncbi:hypothetical protein BaRGS_00002018 [Batillaria attramentaria]|uniref:Uncharacterized protein n=1 Tax=Batillaria attramentaria TaxID=370345 RepID=A0ABD0M4C6_9CAEN
MKRNASVDSFDLLPVAGTVPLAGFHVQLLQPNYSLHLHHSAGTPTLHVLLLAELVRMLFQGEAGFFQTFTMVLELQNYICKAGTLVCLERLALC